MTSPALRKKNGYHFYTKKLAEATQTPYDGPDDAITVFPGVTSLLGGGPAGWWYAKTAATYAVKHENEWHAEQIERDDESAIKLIANAPGRYSKFKAEVGTAVHHCIEEDWLPGCAMDEKVGEFLDQKASRTGKQTHWDIMRKYDPDRGRVIDHILAHEKAYRDVIRDKDLTIIRHELTVCSTTIGFAGTLDAYATDRDGRLVQLDWKTGAHKADWKTGLLYEKELLQQVGYGLADVMVDDGEYLPIEESPEYAVVVGLTDRAYTWDEVEFSQANRDEFMRRAASEHWRRER